MNDKRKAEIEEKKERRKYLLKFCGGFLIGCLIGWVLLLAY